MPIHGIVSTDTTVGTTIGTFDPIDTRNGTVRLTEGSREVVGFEYCGVRAAQTTATAMMGRLRVTSGDLGLAGTDAEFALAHMSGAGIATQSGGFYSRARWLPVQFGTGDISGAAINLSYTQMGIEPADNVSIVVSTAHLVGAVPPPQWYDRAALEGTLTPQGGVSSNGGSTTTARTSLTATTIPGYLHTIIGKANMHMVDAVQTTAEPASAWFEYQSTIGSFTPQEWVAGGINPALLGTLVGLGIFGEQNYLPWWVPKGGNTQTIEAFGNIIATVTGANAMGYALGLRK